MVCVETTAYTQAPHYTGAHPLAVLHSLVWVSAPPPVLVLLVHVDRGRCAVHCELGIVNLRRREGRDRRECSVKNGSARPGAYASSTAKSIPRDSGAGECERFLPFHKAEQSAPARPLPPS